jgi:hypothetical protein
MRVKRGTLRSEKRGDRVYVDLNDVPNADANAVPHAGRNELVEELRDRVRFLEDQLEQANDRDRENRRIVAALTSRIPALEAPAAQESRESPESTGSARTPPDAGEGPQEGARRPFWRRVFRG